MEAAQVQGLQQLLGAEALPWFHQAETCGQDTDLPGGSGRIASIRSVSPTGLPLGQALAMSVMPEGNMAVRRRRDAETGHHRHLGPGGCRQILTAQNR